MATAVTHGIHVTVKSVYEPAHSDPRAAHYLYSYRVTITNTGPDTVKLLRRQWYISDSLAPQREVEGPGVIGETPVLAPGEHFTYSSACDLRSGLGRMYGNYLMERTLDGKLFRVDIPAFLLHFPYSSN
jgi:ApaG protein